MRRLLIAVFESDVSTSFDSVLDLARCYDIGFFKTMKNILSLCTSVFFSGVAELIIVVESTRLLIRLLLIFFLSVSVS